jgi:hypothetical protein
LTAVDCASLARVALTAVHVRFDTAAITDLYITNPLAGRNHFNPQFMPGDSREIEEGKLAEIA